MNTLGDFRLRRAGSLEQIGVPAAAAPDEYLDLSLLVRAARRQAWVIVVCVIVLAGLALQYALSLQPLYTAFSTVLLDEDRAELIDLISEVPSAALRDGTVQSEVEIFKSQELALKVVDQLDLAERRDALNVELSPLGAAVAWVRSLVQPLIEPEAPTAEDAAAVSEPADPREAVAMTLRNNLDVQRVGRSYVLALSYTAPSPVLAQEIAKAYAENYLDFGRSSKASAADSAIEWLRDRTNELRQASLDASRQLEEFRNENGLVSVGERLLSEQQLSELMSQLILAEADVSRAKSISDQANAAIAAGPAAALANLAATGTASDAVTEDLRQQYLNGVRQQRRIVEQFGEDHPEAKRLGKEVSEVEALIFDEVRRRAMQAQNTYEAQSSRADSLRKGLSAATVRSTSDTESLYKLRQLEQTEESYKDLYQSALTRLERTMQQTSLPIVAARILTLPDLPKDASSPSKIKYIALGIALGGMFGGGLALARELTRNRMTSPADVQRLIGLPVLTTAIRPRRLRTVPKPGRPLSPDPRLSDALQSVKLALDNGLPHRLPRSVAFVSTSEDDGRSAIAAGFAAMLSAHGLPTLLVDASPANARRRRKEAGTSLIELLGAPGGRSAAIPSEAAPLSVLTIATDEELRSAAVLAGSDRMNELMADLGEGARYLVFDLPAARDGAAAHAFATYVDATIVVHRTKRSSASAVRALVDRLEWRNKLLGVVLSRG